MSCCSRWIWSRRSRFIGVSVENLAGRGFGATCCSCVSFAWEIVRDSPMVNFVSQTMNKHIKMRLGHRRRSLCCLETQNAPWRHWRIPSIYSEKDLFIACVASVSLRFRSKERGTRVKDRAKNGVSKRAGRILFLGLSLLRNQTETLATQANLFMKLEFRSWLRPRAVSRLRSRFARNKIIKSLCSEWGEIACQKRYV